MSTHPLHISSGYVSLPAARPAVEGYSDRLTLTGAFLFATAVLVFASGFKELRPEIGGLMLHPYLIPVGLIFPFMFISRLQQFPVKPLAGMTVFLAIYVAATLNGEGGGLGEIFKIACAGMVIVGSALLVQRHSDFVAGAVGLNVAVAILAVKGLDEADRLGFQGVDAANKNAYSLYALPAILLAGFIILRMPQTRRIWKILLGFCAIAALIGIFMSGNRSGYLGAVLIAMMLFWDRKIRGLLLVLAIGGIVAFWILNFGSTVILQRRLEQTREGTESDRLRKDLLLTCVQVGIQNPVLGVSPQDLPFVLGRKTQHGIADPHNVYGQIIGGCGLLCFAAFMYTGVTLWKWARPIKNPEADQQYADIAKLLRMLLFLYAVRGFFSREILYSAGFCLALGMVIGIVAVQQRFKLRPAMDKQGKRFPPATLLPVLGT